MMIKSFMFNLAAMRDGNRLIELKKIEIQIEWRAEREKLSMSFKCFLMNRILCHVSHERDERGRKKNHLLLYQIHIQFIKKHFLPWQ